MPAFTPPPHPTPRPTLTTKAPSLSQYPTFHQGPATWACPGLQLLSSLLPATLVSCPRAAPSAGFLCPVSSTHLPHPGAWLTPHAVFSSLKCRLFRKFSDIPANTPPRCLQNPGQFLQVSWFKTSVISVASTTLHQALGWGESSCVPSTGAAWTGAINHDCCIKDEWTLATGSPVQ